jgi:hypothetical protein
MEAAMQGKKYIMGLFKNEDQVVSTLAALNRLQISAGSQPDSES